MKKDKTKRKQNYPDCYFESVIGKEGCGGYTTNLVGGIVRRVSTELKIIKEL